MSSPTPSLDHEIDRESDISREDTPLHERERTPLPKLQLFVAFLIQLAEPITATVIYPFINQFVRETGITKGDEKATGYYAGIIESVFFMAECVTVLPWGMASDRFGRRPILLLGPLGLTFAMFAFGMSNNYWSLVVIRFCQGALNGNIGVSKSVMTELSDATNMADVFSLIPMMWSLGSTSGPIIGGIFSRPADSWPDTFGKIAILREHPYLLPCAISGSLAFIFFCIAFVALKETLPSKVQAKAIKKSQSSDTLTADDDYPGANYGTISHRNASRSRSPTRSQSISKPPSPSTVTISPSIRSLMIPDVLIPLGNFGILLFTETSYLVLIPLMYTTSIPNGGLGFTPFEVGTILGVWGVCNFLYQAFVVSRVIRRFGPKKVHIFGYTCHLIGFSMYIVLNMVARARGGVDWIVWALIVVQFACCNTMIYMSFATGHMFIVDGAPSRAAIAVTNGLGQAAGTIARTIAPAFATSLFSVSTELNLLGGYLVFYVLIALTLVGIRMSLLLPEGLRRAH